MRGDKIHVAIQILPAKAKDRHIPFHRTVRVYGDIVFVMRQEKGPADVGVTEIDPLLVGDISLPAFRGKGLSTIGADDEITPGVQRTARRPLVEEPVVVVDLEYRHPGIVGVDLPGALPLVVVGDGVELHLDRALAPDGAGRRGRSGVEMSLGIDQVGDAPEIPRRAARGMMVNPVVAVYVKEA